LLVHATSDPLGLENIRRKVSGQKLRHIVLVDVAIRRRIGRQFIKI
jgi:hypothetical protein